MIREPHVSRVEPHTATVAEGPFFEAAPDGVASKWDPFSPYRGRRKRLVCPVALYAPNSELRFPGA